MKMRGADLVPVERINASASRFCRAPLCPTMKKVMSTALAHKLEHARDAVQ